VVELYQALTGNPSLMPPDWRDAAGEAGDKRTAEVVRDYIAGMTDRFALAEYRRILHTEIDL
jgi:dGTPase